MSKRLVVFGGSGFVGQSIVNQAVRKNFQVISISRGGRPKQYDSWMDQVKWVAADVFEPAEWQDQLMSGDVVVDAIGILTESKAKKQTYQNYHYELVRLVVEQLNQKTPSLFVYISAAHGLPFFKGYLYWKKQAEDFLAMQSFPVSIFRPSLLYGTGRKYSRTMAKTIKGLKKLPFLRAFFVVIQPTSVDLLAKNIVETIEESLEGKDDAKRETSYS